MRLMCPAKEWQLKYAGLDMLEYAALAKTINSKLDSRNPTVIDHVRYVPCFRIL